MSAGTIGKYERLDVLGHGTSGIVYLAWDTLLRRQVALKEIRADGPETERLLEEARVLDRLKHPNIVRIHSVDVAPGNIILLDMELVKGRNLASLLKERAGTPLAPQDATRIAISILDALGYAHERRIIHRDVKPANILLGDDGVVKLTDFGLAEALGTGSVAGGGGTYPYMAPEDFAEDAASDRRSDLWAVGVLLYEMLTGKRPFTVQRIKDPFAWKRAVEQDDPPRPSDINPDLSPEWNALLAVALTKNKEKRFGTARQFMDAVARIVPQAVPTLDDPSAVDNRKRETTSDSIQSRNGHGSNIPVFAPPVPGIPGGAFVFTSTGEIVYTLDELLRVAARNWDESRRALLDGRMEGFLRGIGEVYVGELAGDMFRRGHRGESPDRLLKEFLDRAQGEEVTAAYVPVRKAPDEMGTVVAPRNSALWGGMPPRERPVEIEPVAQKPLEQRTTDDKEQNEQSDQSTKSRWWYWPVLLLCVTPPGAATASLMGSNGTSGIQPVDVYLASGLTAGILAAMLMFIAIGLRLSWPARLLPLVPMGLGGLCIGGLIAEGQTAGVQNLGTLEMAFLSIPIFLLLLQALTARKLWRLWLGLLITLAAGALILFATIR